MVTVKIKLIIIPSAYNDFFYISANISHFSLFTLHLHEELFNLSC